MHARTKIKDLTWQQFEALDQILQTRYEFPDGGTRLCVEFEAAPTVERHIQMPIEELSKALRLLELVGRGAKLRRLADGRLIAVEPRLVEAVLSETPGT